jgi:Ca-activated chloride channel homolog
MSFSKHSKPVICFSMKISKLTSLVSLLAIIVVAICAFSFTSKHQYQTVTVSNHLLPDTNVFMGQSTIKTNGLITFTTGLDNGYYLIDSANKTGYIYLETKAGKFVPVNNTRLPLNIALVLDHSGSMMGAKMDYVKEAAKFVVDNLSSEDYLSIIVYDDEVTILQPSAKVTDKAAIKALIARVQADGSTNLSGGTLEGYSQVKTAFRSECVNRVLLLSDGLANVGITDTAQLQKIARDRNLEHSISLSTFGVGADYNEDLMTAMAEFGSGNYYFIEAPDKIPQIFEKELSGLLNVVAQNAVMELELPQGTTLDYVFGYKYEQKGNKIFINFRDVYSDETKGVLVKFAIKDKTDAPLIFNTQLKYDDAQTTQRVVLNNTDTRQPTNDYALYRINGNEPVVQQIVVFEANRRMEMAMREVDLGNYSSARSLMQQNTVYIQKMSGVVKVNKEIILMDSINTGYNNNIKNIEQKGTSERKRLQKSSKEENYKVKKKK